MKINLIEIYQSDPFDNLQGGGVRYVKNLTLSLKGCNKILFLGVGKKEYVRENISFSPITKKMTEYVQFLIRLSFHIVFKKLNSYQIAHVHRLYFALPFILLKPKLKLVCTIHSPSFNVFKSKYGNTLLYFIRPFFKLIEIFCIKNIDHLVPVSNSVLDTYYQKYPKLMSKKEITILGSMIDRNLFKIKQSSYLQDRFGKTNKYLLFIGRLAHVKNIDFLIEMFDKQFKADENIKFIIVGRGEYETKVKAWIESAINKPILLGEVESDQIPDLISSANILLLSSHYEASPTVVKEALLCGIPVVTSDVGDVNELIISNRNGFVVEKKYENYSDAIKTLLKKDISKSNIQNYSIERIQENFIETISDKYLDIFKKVITE
ncbi:MAG: glycosyltransferase family 4 protein [Leptospiraceae bacterium]|nr:glycosyltransferase family 4 protein [Leptospiraceae bacterium]